MIRDWFLGLKRGRTPKRLREDFCGTFGVCCEWVKLGADYRAFGRDLDPEPLAWGRSHHLAKLTAAQRGRVAVAREDVRTPGVPAADLIVALNFSCFVLKTRRDLLAYFTNARASLRRGGVLALDAFGGPKAFVKGTRERAYPGFIYRWEQLGGRGKEARFAIHFKPNGKRALKNAFVYDWRLWSVAELRGLLARAGFRASTAYPKKGSSKSLWSAVILAEK
jgi:SAM-dependent methyltransferase